MATTSINACLLSSVLTLTLSQLSSDLVWQLRLFNFVRRNRPTYCCSWEAKNLAYLSLVRPHLEYAAAAWYPYMAKDIQQLERVQRRAAHFVKIIAI